MSDTSDYAPLGLVGWDILSTPSCARG